jgi:hypothetical protein
MPTKLVVLLIIKADEKDPFKIWNLGSKLKNFSTTFAVEHL